MCSYFDVSDRFHLRRDGCDVGPQYASLYHCRAQQLGPRAVSAGNRSWGPPSETCKWTNAVDAQTLVAKEIRIVGVLYRRSNNPLIESRALKGTTVERVEELVRLSLHDDTDGSLKIEDASGRLALRLGEGVGLDKTALDLLIPGSVVAIVGRYSPLAITEQGTPTFQHDTGAFEVLGVRGPGPLAQPSFGLTQPEGVGCVAIVSGLSLVGGDTLDVSTSTLLRYLTFHAQQGRVVRVIVAGNGTRPWDPSTGADGTDASDVPLVHMRGLDRFLALLTESVPVDYMCGATDLGPGALPQPPLFKALLPEATKGDGLHLCTNPYACLINGYHFLGSSGQPIDDARAQMPLEAREEGGAPLRVLSSTLALGHLAPTAPGTLYSHAFVNEDPFVIDTRPHVYFAGNQPSGNDTLEATYSGEWTRVLVVPRFTEGSTVAMISLEDGCPCDFVHF